MSLRGGGDMKSRYFRSSIVSYFAFSALLLSQKAYSNDPNIPWLKDDPGLVPQSLVPTMPASISNGENERIPSDQLGPRNPATIELYSAVAMAVDVHPSVNASIKDVLEQESLVDSAKSNYYPKIHADLSSGRVGEYGSSQLATISLSQVVYDFGKTENEVGQAAGALTKSNAKLFRKIDEVAHRAAEAYINVHRYQTLLIVARKQVSALRDVFDKATLRAGSGLATQSDPIQARSRLESSEANQVEVETLLAQWREQLGLLIGQGSNVMIGSIPEDFEYSVDFDRPVNYEALPEILEASAERQSALALLEFSRAQRYPTLALEASSNHALAGENPNNGEDQGSFNTIMLKGTALLYQGGAISAQIRAANARVLAAEELIRDAKLRIDERIRKAAQEISGSRKRLSVLGRRYNSILETETLYQEQYKLGSRSILDLLNAEQEVYLAATDREDAKYSYLLGLVDYVAASGKSRKVYRINDAVLQGAEVRP